MNVGCGKPAPGVSGKIPVVPLKYRVESLDPVLSTDEASGLVLSFLNTKLYRYSLSGKLENELVKNESRSGWIVTLTLKAKPENNNLTASDAAYCLNRLKNSGKQGWVLDKIKSIKSQGETLVIELNPGKRNAAAEWHGQKIKLSLPQASLYSEKIHRSENRFDSLNKTHIIENSQSKLSLNTIEFPVLSDETARWFFFKSGLPDVYEANGLFRFLEYDSLMYSMVDLSEFVVLYAALSAGNYPEHILANKQFRQYLNFRFNRKLICEKNLLNACEAADYPVPDGLHKKLPEFYKYSAADFTGKLSGNENIKIYSNPDRERQLLAFIIRDILVQMKINTEIIVTDMPSIIRFSNDGRPGIYLMKWAADYPHAENFLFPLFYSENAGTGGNRSWYKNLRADKILSESDYSEKDITLVQEIIREDAPWLFIGFMKQRFYLKKNGRVTLPSSFAGWGPSALKSF